MEELSELGELNELDELDEWGELDDLDEFRKLGELDEFDESEKFILSSWLWAWGGHQNCTATTLLHTAVQQLHCTMCCISVAHL